MNRLTTFSKIFIKRMITNTPLGNGCSFKMYYEALWIHFMDAICTLTISIWYQLRGILRFSRLRFRGERAFDKANRRLKGPRAKSWT